MILKKHLLLIFVFAFSLIKAQEMPVSYAFGEKYSDKHKYSNLVSIANQKDGSTILVRSYYAGLILKPKGYLIEHYNKDLELISEYNYKLKGHNFVDGYLKNGQLFLLFLDYNHGTSSYDYTVHYSPLDAINFTEKNILSIPSEEVNFPLDKNYYNRNFSSGFTTSVLFNDDKSAFVISTHFKKRKVNQHYIYLFDANLNKLITHDFSKEVEEKNYAFEEIAIAKNLKRVYIIGKAYFKKKRFLAKERRFQYEMIQVSNSFSKTQTFDDPGKYSEALKPILTADNKLLCVGFYSNRKDDRYNGVGYFSINPQTLELTTKKYHPFSTQFMQDKFGKDAEKEIKNLVFKNLSITPENAIVFNAEEYFVTSNFKIDAGSGNRVKVKRYHYNDMVSAKLDASGDLVWTRNINKSEVTQHDEAYVSYSTYIKGEDSYFFISTASEQPEQLGKDRIIFRQGFSRNRNVFLIKLDAKGDMSYEKIIDDKDARLPLMVSKPLIVPEDDTVFFYAKRGNKKQLVKVIFE